MFTTQNFKKNLIKAITAVTIVASAFAVTSTGASAATSSSSNISASSSFRIIRIGERSSSVRDMQLALIKAGISVPGGADGIFGPATKNALISYQTKMGIRARGILNRRTAIRLGLVAGASTPNVAPSAPAPINKLDESNPPRVGQTNSQVKLLQQGLIIAGIHVSGGADGAFGSATATAVKEFQAMKQLPQTGVVDNATAKAVNEYLSLSTSGLIKVFPVQGTCGFSDTWHAPRSGGRLHEGVDIIAAGGKYLYAANDGVISKITVDGELSGNALRLTMDNGTYFFYGHLREFAPGIAVGTRVSAGQIIGTVGDTGETTVNHLHLEIHPGGGDPVNPYPFVKAVDNCQSSIVPLQPGLGFLTR